MLNPLPPIIHDMVFKAIFTKRVDLLQDLINTFPDFMGDKRIINLEIQQTLLGADSISGKSSILDLYATDYIGRKLIIEVQNYQQNFFGDRVLFYASRVFSRQLLKSEEYSELKPVFSINFLNHTMFPNSNRWFHSFRLRDEESGKIVLTDKLKVSIIELSKINKKYTDNLTELEAWMIAIKEKNPTKTHDGMKIILEKYPSIEEAYKEYELLTGTEEFVLSYEAKRKAELDYNSILSTAKENAKIEGIEQGIHHKAIETAKKLQNKGFSKEEILEITGLTEESYSDSM
jgi:predicted transposase/invertase (TIGR01784 family)